MRACARRRTHVVSVTLAKCLTVSFCDLFSLFWNDRRREALSQQACTCTAAAGALRRAAPHTSTCSSAPWSPPPVPQAELLGALLPLAARCCGQRLTAQWLRVAGVPLSAPRTGRLPLSVSKHYKRAKRKRAGRSSVFDLAAAGSAPPALPAADCAPPYAVRRTPRRAQWRHRTQLPRRWRGARGAGRVRDASRHLVRIHRLP